MLEKTENWKLACFEWSGEIPRKENCCASLRAPDQASESDALIGATALVHGLTVVTRNVGDFQSSGVALINPWEQ
jgi:hypothetical protein